MQRRYRMTVLIMLLLGISLGYALLTSNLNILGVANILNPTWDIHFENVQVKSGSVTAPTPAIDSNQTTVSYSVTLNTPGDFYEFTVDAVNAGTIDGMITEISSTLNNVEITNNLPPALEYSIKYDDGIELAKNQLLASGKSVKYKVRVGYKTDINPEDLPDTEETLNLTLTVTYQQADDSAQTIERPTIKKYGSDSTSDFKSDTYRENIKIINIGTQISPPENVIESWDIGVDQNGNVMAYITENASDNTMYDLYIQGRGYLFANTDSAYLFKNLRGVEAINNLNLLNTYKTTNMNEMFNNAGYNASSFIIDVSGFDTSKVTRMPNMFKNAGNNATTWSIGNLSKWDTSKVTSMSSMFRDTGRNATTWTLGDLSNWNTSNVKGMEWMFSGSGYSSPTWDI